MSTTGKNKRDELTVTADEVSRTSHIPSKAVEYAMQLRVQRKPVYWLNDGRHSGGMTLFRLN
ncbi:hypothetical protein RCC89_19885 [Cytophagaceae bacterium ABcell3]|nr:hypothetical protein RCC89_19740 [Cytophagaceae bacterium ABcell3]WMJ75402.1 hypothetical protein RCC89_19885 [Cytophagaceae bacterium ABcell3]